MPFIESLIEHSMLYEFDVLVNKFEHEQQQKSGGRVNYFCEAFCGALISFFEKKLPLLDEAFHSDDVKTKEKLDKVLASTYEKFLCKVVAVNKDHLKVEFCDQVAIDMQIQLFEDTYLKTLELIRNPLPACCFY